VGYFNDEQLVFIERYAFKVDDALEVAASYDVKVTRISQHQLDDFMNTYSSSSPLPSPASTIKPKSIDTTPGVVVETAPTITAINLIQQDDTASRIVIEATPTSAKTNPIHHDDKVINNFFTTSPPTTPTPGCGLNEELFRPPNQVEQFKYVHIILNFTVPLLILLFIHGPYLKKKPS
jgi:hypothetical protein